jgi:hypothetical protein
MQTIEQTNDQSFTSVYLDSLRTLFEATRNPVYVWSTILWCLGEYPETPLPRWCLDYLEISARNLNALYPIDYSEHTGGRGRKAFPKAPDAAQMVKALGLIRGTKNAFRDARSDSRNVRAAVEYLQRRKMKWPAKEALAEVMEWRLIGVKTKPRVLLITVDVS